MESAEPRARIPRRFFALCAIDFSARTSYNMARTPVLPLFAAALGAGPAMVGLIVAASTITGIFLKAPAGAISDQVGRRRTLLFGAAVFGLNIPLGLSSHTGDHLPEFVVSFVLEH